MITTAGRFKPKKVLAAEDNHWLGKSSILG
jgi:hypothetical protein